MSVTLDAGAYPHILQAILDASPYASLVKFRLVSRGLRDAADARLCEHLCFEDGVIYSMGRGSDPGGRMLRGGWFLNAELDRAVRVVDLYPDTNAEARHVDALRVIGPYLSNIAVIRQRGRSTNDYFEDYCDRMRAPAVVLFWDLYPENERDWVHPEDLENERGLDLVDEYTRLNADVHERAWVRAKTLSVDTGDMHGAKTLIVYVRYLGEDGFADQLRDADVNTADTVEHVVMIFSPTSDHPSIKCAPCPQGWRTPDTSLTTLYHLAMNMVALLETDQLRFTFVDMHRLPLGWMITTPHANVAPWLPKLAATPNDIPAMFITALAYLGRGDIGDTVVEAREFATNRIRFLSSAQWREEVGERMYELATVEEYVPVPAGQE